MLLSVKFMQKLLQYQSFLILILVEGIFLEHFSYAQNNSTIPLFIDDFTFEGFSENKEETERLGRVFAAELQSLLQGNTLITAYTRTNLQDQMKKEEEKALLGCTDNSCLKQIIENFGISDQIQGTIRKLSKNAKKKKNIKETYQIYVSYIVDDDVISSVSETFQISSKNPDVFASLLVAELKKKKLEEKLFSEKLITHLKIRVDELNLRNTSAKKSSFHFLYTGKEIQNQQVDEKGYLVITSKPSGAAIMINGKMKGSTTFQQELMVGRYIIILEKPFYLPYKVEKVLSQNGVTLDVELVPNYGSVQIETAPNNADVFLDNEYIGHSPLDIKYKSVGDYQLRIYKEHYLPITESIKIENQKTTIIRRELSENFGSISLQLSEEIKNNPYGYLLYLNNKPLKGKEDLNILDVGMYILRIESPGYLTSEQEVTITAKRKTNVEAVLKPDYRLVKVEAFTTVENELQPLFVPIYVDGKETFLMTPAKVQVLSRPTKISVRDANGKAKTETVDPSKSKELPMVVFELSRFLYQAYARLELNYDNDLQVSLDKKPFEQNFIELSAGKHELAFSKNDFTVGVYDFQLRPLVNTILNLESRKLSPDEIHDNQVFHRWYKITSTLASVLSFSAAGYFFLEENKKADAQNKNLALMSGWLPETAEYQQYHSETETLKKQTNILHSFAIGLSITGVVSLGWSLYEWIFHTDGSEKRNKMLRKDIRLSHDGALINEEDAPIFEIPEKYNETRKEKMERELEDMTKE